MGCDVNTGRIAQLTQANELYWCPDYFGLLKNILIANDDHHKDIGFTSIAHAFYTEHDTEYWLTYYFAETADLDFLQVYEYDAILSLSGYHEYTIYDKDEMADLADMIRSTISISSTTINLTPAATKAFDHYITFWREILFLYAESAADESPWAVAKYVHKTKGVSNKLMDWYIRQHRCPVCGCYYTSTETTCVHCSFPELNVQFVNKEEYLLWEKEKLIPYREFYKLQNR